MIQLTSLVFLVNDLLTDRFDGKLGNRQAEARLRQTLKKATTVSLLVLAFCLFIH